MTDQSDANKTESPDAGQTEPEGSAPESPSTPTPAEKTEEESDELDSSTIFKLGVVCVILWIVAGGIFFSKMGQAKVDYHLGNMAESLAKGGTISEDDIKALVELGPEAVPNLVKELNSSTETGRIGIGVLVVLGRMEGDAAKKALTDALVHPNYQVRNNACVQLIKHLDDAAVTAMVKDLWVKADVEARVQMARFVFFKVKKEIAVSFILEGVVDQTLRVRGFSIEFLRVKYPDLAIPKDGHTAPRKKLLVYSPLVKKWIAAGAKKESAPKYPDFDRKKALENQAPTPENEEKPKDTK
ncbi:MAG: hypothetical protein P1V97_28905 [Planctomycetota bacterium]|nr:hypothetical protein [Planctomycetota bacterium]